MLGKFMNFKFRIKKLVIAMSALLVLWGSGFAFLNFQKASTFEKRAGQQINSFISKDVQLDTTWDQNNIEIEKYKGRGYSGVFIAVIGLIAFVGYGVLWFLFVSGGWLLRKIKLWT